MNDDVLDQLLARADVPTSAAATRLATQLAGVGPRGTRTAPSKRRRIGLLVGGVVGGVALVAGAGSVTAYQLSIPPFQTTDAGTLRIEPGVAVDYTNSLGRRVECLAFMEFAHVDNGQIRALEAVAAEPDWAGYGDRTLAALKIPTASSERQNAALFDAVSDALWRRARSAVPGLEFMRDSDGPVFHGTAMSCTGPGGVDGRP